MPPHDMDHKVILRQIERGGCHPHLTRRGENDIKKRLWKEKRGRKPECVPAFGSCWEGWGWHDLRCSGSKVEEIVSDNSHSTRIINIFREEK